MPKIYTKTGDKGQTSLCNGKRVNKYDARIEAIGAVDELNARFGIIKNIKLKIKNYNTKLKITELQKDLFYIGALLSGAGKIKNLKLDHKIFQAKVKNLEADIDAISELMPPLRHFILPGGSEMAAEIHIARAVCRTAERRVASLLNTKSQIIRDILPYLNRLSDFLFVLARLANQDAGIKEEEWQGEK